VISEKDKANLVLNGIRSHLKKKLDALAHKSQANESKDAKHRAGFSPSFSLGEIKTLHSEPSTSGQEQYVLNIRKESEENSYR
jgi:hypothetical protein